VSDETRTTWKGTVVCGDFHCECGNYAHICGAGFMYSIKCHKCGVVWQVPTVLALERSSNKDGDINTSAFEGDDR
jgi:hypothetical protein